MVFECDNSTSCWCTKVSKLQQNEINDNDCMCKDCLLKKYQKRFIQT